MFIKLIKNFIKKTFHLVDEEDYLELRKLYNQNIRELAFYKHITIRYRKNFDEKLLAKKQKICWNEKAEKYFISTEGLVQDGQIYCFDETFMVYFVNDGSRAIVVSPMPKDLSDSKTKKENKASSKTKTRVNNTKKKKNKI